MFGILERGTFEPYMAQVLFLFTRNVFIYFLLCVIRAVSVPCEFSVVVSGGTARWQKLVGFVEVLDGVVKNKNAVS